MPAEGDFISLTVRCPTCHERCELQETDSSREIHCEWCGTSFSLVLGDTKTFVPDGNDLIGHFQLLNHLGSGSFGDVWMARDTVLDRLVALKVARSDGRGTSDPELFFREARAAAQLKHPNIVRVHELGRDSDRVFIVSDFIRGATLADHLASRRCSAREAAELCIVIANGIHHAHKMGIVHRDLKPQNILLDLAGVPHIADFGLAKRETGEVTLTADGQIIGTPAYMSPEQAIGYGHQSDRRTDIYSLGVILFLMLTGELPFRGNHRMLLVQIVNDPPPSPRRLESKVPKDLETICLKCLEKKPEHRYQTAAELAQDLRRWLDFEPIRASPPGLTGRIRRWSQRKPALASLITVLIAVTVAGIAAFAWQYRQTATAHHELMVAQVERLGTANSEELHVLIDNINRFGSNVVPELRKRRNAQTFTEKQRMRYAIALLPYDPKEADYLLGRVDLFDADEFDLICDSLAPQADRLTPRLWESIRAEGIDAATQLRLAAMLAAFNPETKKWESIAIDVVSTLTTLDEIDARRWLRLFTPSRKWLLPEFRSLFATSTHPTVRLVAAHALSQFLNEDPQQLIPLIGSCDAQQLRVMITALKDCGDDAIRELELMAQLGPDPSEDDAKAICNAAIALAHMNHTNLLWGLMEDDVPPNVRLAIISRMAASGVEPMILATRLMQQNSTSIQRGLLLGLGEYETYRITTSLRKTVARRAFELLETDPDAGVHSAARWLLQTWGIDYKSKLQPQPIRKDRNWFIDPSGRTMAVVHEPVTFTIGSPLGEPARSQDEDLREVHIPYAFAVATTEVTRREYEEFIRSLEDPTTGASPHEATIGPVLDCPVNNLGYNHVAAFCRWLTLKNGMSEEDMCFPPVDLKRKDAIAPYPNFLERAGYRLPTEAEWEYLCRAGTSAARFTGDSPEILEEYAWFADNSNRQSWPVGTLKPNPFGMFDIYGNLTEMVLPDGAPPSLNVIVDRGGSYQYHFRRIRSAAKRRVFSNASLPERGFRVARTITSP